MQPSSFRDSLNAILMACTAWFLYCICDVMMKWMAADISPALILAVAGWVGVTMMGGWILARHGWRGFLTPHWKWYFVRGVCAVAASYLVIMAISRIPLADFYGIVFASPMLTTLMAVLFLREKIGIQRISALVLGFIGVIVILGPTFSDPNIGYIYALASVTFVSLSAIVLRKIGRESVVARYGFYPCLANLLCFTPLFLMNPHMPEGTVNYAILLGMPVLSVMGILFYSMAFARARDTAVITPFHYSQMIWGALFGYLIFSEIPTIQTFLGSGIIVASGLFVLWREHVHHKRIAKIALDIPV